MGGAPAPAAQDAATAAVAAALSSSTSPSPSSSASSSPGPEVPPASLAKPKRPSTTAAEAAAASQSDGTAAAPPPQQKQQQQQQDSNATASAAAPMVQVDDDNKNGGDFDEEKPPAAEGPCRMAGCGKVTAYRCKSCGEAFYCSRAHQRAHWATERQPDGTWGGHHKECVERAWLPAAPVPPLPPPPPSPKQQQEGQEGKAGEEVLLWSSSNGVGDGGEEGNAAKRTKVSDGRELAPWTLTVDGGGGSGGGNPQALWTIGQPAPGTDAATALAMQTTGFWKSGDGGNGDGGPTTQRGDGYLNKSFEDAILGDALGALHEIGMSGGPPSPLPLGGFDDPNLPAPIHPVGFEDPGTVGMAGGPSARPAPPSEEAIMQLMEMGFDEADARSALVVHANDVSRALDYLLNTGGGMAEPPPFDSEAMASAMALSQLGGGGGGGGEAPGENQPWVIGPPP